jgi:hypothetical protein
MAEVGQGLSGKLRPLAPAPRRSGLHLEFDRPGHERSRTVLIIKAAPLMRQRMPPAVRTVRRAIPRPAAEARLRPQFVSASTAHLRCSSPNADACGRSGRLLANFPGGHNKA